ncbi:helix-turn-helix psq domain [Holotrichia oblita]|uniref:Helix-turn-helix psq domain n=1 Tax=Holotrichia oblita TaxID=644536 RepID=A0ACB9T6L2_HOLOL|nr:helix-turn-helix psq domain [Holotrichia oblita]
MIAKALEDILNNSVSKKAAAINHSIPRSTLQFRLSEKFTKSTLALNPTLSHEEKQILVEWILQSHRKGFPIRKEDLQISVKTFLEEKPRKTLSKRICRELGGETTPPFVIYPYQRLPAPIAVSVPDEWGVGTSPNGWMKA